MDKELKQKLEYDDRKKSASIAFLFLILGGAFGFHRFYLGRIKSGVLILLAGLLAVVTYIVGSSLLYGIVADNLHAVVNDPSGAPGLDGLVVASIIIFLPALAVLVWVIVDVFLVSRYVREHNEKLTKEIFTD